MRLSPMFLCAALLTTSSFALADEEDDAPKKTHMASPALVGGGIALATIGTAAIPTGIIFSMVRSACSGGCAGPDGFNVFGYSMIIGGSAFLLGGVTMFVFGVRQVPVSISATGPAGTPGMTARITF